MRCVHVKCVWVVDEAHSRSLYSDTIRAILSLGYCVSTDG